jgi:predicted DCC family thiol-disulfide oxidoreductase YuxK
MPAESLLADIGLLTTSGRLISGAEVYLYVARRIWWAWPFYAIFSLPGFNRLIHAGYRWFARNRYCISHSCRLHPS